MKINFVLPPVPKITGGPLAILEYANRLIDRGHDVTITTYPDIYWKGENPFPWFPFKGEIRYPSLRKKMRRYWESDLKSQVQALGGVLGSLRKGPKGVLGEVANAFCAGFMNAGSLNRILGRSLGSSGSALIDNNISQWMSDLLQNMSIISSMPECDLNVATWWMTTFPVYFSGKGKPVYFMQHYEELFYPEESSGIFPKLASRMSYSLPMYKVANSSWLQGQISRVCGQDVPFSTNGLDLAAFSPGPKTSERDGIIRVITYARPEAWKGLADACAAMKRIRQRFQNQVEWHVFGYLDAKLPPDNPDAPYRHHTNLSLQELAQLYSSADIALCPSWYESFPLPPIEAMASGVATVTTRYGTEEYASDEKNALVIPPRDIDAMTTAIRRLVEDRLLREKLAREGRQTALSFNWDTAVKVREKILIDIHEERVNYDRFGPSRSFGPRV